MKKVKIKEILPYIVFVILFFTYHLFMNGKYSDDAWFCHALDESNPFAFLMMRYHSLAARIVPEFFCCIIAHQNFWLFRIVNIAVFVAIIYSIEKLILGNLEHPDVLHLRWLIVSSILIYPIQDMSAAGWMASSTNYTWTACAILAVMAILKRLQSTSGTSFLWALLLVFCTLYAGFQEQSAALLIILLLYVSYISFERNRKSVILPICLTAIAVICLIIMENAPASSNRMALEIGNWMPEFGTYSLMDKAIMGVTRMEKVFVAQPIGTFFLFALMLSIYSWLNTRNIYSNIVSSLPLLIVLTYRFICDFIPTLKAIFIMPEDIVGVNYFDYNTYLPIFIVIILGFSILYAYWTSLDRKSAIQMTVITIGGVITQVAMGLSPTIYASTRRTSVFLFFVFIYITVWLWWNSWRNKTNDIQRVILQSFLGISLIFSILYYIQNEIYIVLTGL